MCIFVNCLQKSVNDCRNPCSHSNRYVQSQFNGAHFFCPQLISSFLSDLSLTQLAEGLGRGGACCASCLELHLLLCLLGQMAINFHKVQNTMHHGKNSESTHNPAASAHFLTPSPPLPHFTHIKPLLWEGIDTGQSDVSSRSCQHTLFIYPVILSIVDLVT